MKVLLNVREAAFALGIGRSTIYDLMGAGLLASVKIGSRRLIAVSSLNEYVASLPRDADA